MPPLAACHCCGLVHTIPPIDRRSIACCVRCRTVIRHGTHPRNASRTVALTIAAIVIYPIALTLPVMQIERLGYVSDASIWSGMVGLLSEGHLFVGLVILLFSIVAPVGKLGLLLTLCVGRRGLGRRDRASVYKLIEFIGRWGMVDVLLVAVLVAMVKLGDVVQVTPGPGVVAFGVVVMLSLIASAIFDPHAIWEEDL
ncbi:MAG: paraquat-inducible protein A [Phycisphaerales bacterium]|nr:paraquat-inducible protein A [Phycisphaerales bacterium]